MFGLYSILFEGLNQLPTFKNLRDFTLKSRYPASFENQTFRKSDQHSSTTIQDLCVSCAHANNSKHFIVFPLCQELNNLQAIIHFFHHKTLIVLI